MGKRVSPVDGGCWFCHTKDDEMVFDTEFDTFVHIECVRKHQNCKNPCEGKFMAYLLPENCVEKS